MALPNLNNQFQPCSEMDMISQFADLLNNENHSKTIRIETTLPNLSNEYQNCLVLVIVSPRTFLISNVRELLHKTWKCCSQKFFVSEFTTKTYLIKFESHSDLEFIMECSPWVVRDNLLAL